MIKSKSTKPVSRIVWDADGVLVDSQALAYSVATDLVQALGYHSTITSQDDYRNAFGVGRESSLGLAPDECTALRTAHRTAMKNRSGDLRCIQQGLEAIRHVEPYSLVVTSAFSDGILQVISRSGINVPVKGREHGTKTGILRAELAKAPFVYVTDTTTDVIRCREVGVLVIAVDWGYDEVANLQSAAPDHLCSSAAELLGAIAHCSSLDFKANE